MKRFILARLALVLLALLIPVYLIGYALYRDSSEALWRELKLTVSSQASYFISEVQSEFSHMRLLLLDLTADEDLRALAQLPESMDHYERGRAMLRVMQRLYAVRTACQLFSTVRAHVPAIGKTLSGAPGYDALDDAEYRALSAAQGPEWAAGELVVPLPSLSLRNPAPIVLLSARLSKDRLAVGMRALDAGGGVSIFTVGGVGAYSESVDMTSEEGAQLLDALARAQGREELRWQGGDYLCYRTSSQDGLLSVVRLIRKGDVLSVTRRSLRFVWVFTLASLLMLAVYFLYTYRAIHRPLRRLLAAFDYLKGGDLRTRVAVTRGDEFGRLYREFNDMAEKLDAQVDQAYRQRLLSQRAELKQLQAQINPHFLYNSFFILSRMIQSGGPEAAAFSRQLGTYFQFIARDGADTVELCREVEHARIYAQIQAMRFSNRLSLSFGELPEEIAGVTVPRLLLQPVIENAFEHGLRDKAGGGLLSVRFAQAGGQVRVTVQDNGGALDDDALGALAQALHDDGAHPSEMTGLRNIHRRLRLTFGQAGGLELSRAEIGGLRVDVVFPTEKWGIACPDC